MWILLSLTIFLSGGVLFSPGLAVGTRQRFLLCRHLVCACPVPGSVPMMEKLMSSSTQTSFSISATFLGFLAFVYFSVDLFSS